MKKPNHVPIPRLRRYRGPAVLALGLRPFFFLSGLLGASVLPIFLAAHFGLLPFALPADLTGWHVHEMLFGFAGAAVAGFLLTAVPNWTGRMPLQGLPLAVLVGLWVLARIAMLFSGVTPAWFVAILAVLFPVTILMAIGREVVSGRNWRNVPVLAGLTAIAVTDALFQADLLGGWESAGAIYRLGISAFVMMIGLVGGRIIPSFTHNWLKARGETGRPPGFTAYDKAVLVTTLLALLCWVGLPGTLLTSLLAAVAAVANGIRLARWRGHRTLSEPLVWVLHLGYGWMVLGLALVAGNAAWDGIPSQAAVHALTVGAMGTMILAVMSRATLGHSGRPLHAGPILTLAYILVTVSAIARVAAAVANTGYSELLLIGGVAWVAAMLIFLAICGPMLLRRRSQTD